MMNIFLCDDNEFLLSKYADKIREFGLKHQISICFQTFSSGEALILHQRSEDAMKPNILFLDILMGGINGIDTVKKLRELGCDAEVIFLTSSEEYVFRSFDVEPLYYFIKGVHDADKLEDIFLKAVEFIRHKDDDILIVEDEGITKKIPLKDIFHFEVSDQTITVHTEEGVFFLYANLDALEEQLFDKNFVRCHDSYIINVKTIDEIYKSSVVLINGVEIPVGKFYNKAVKLSFSNCLSNTF